MPEACRQTLSKTPPLTQNMQPPKHKSKLQLYADCRICTLSYPPTTSNFRFYRLLVEHQSSFWEAV